MADILDRDGDTVITRDGDTVVDRFSSVDVVPNEFMSLIDLRLPWRRLFFYPDGTIGEGDMRALAGLYSGLAGVPEAAPGSGSHASSGITTGF